MIIIIWMMMIHFIRHTYSDFLCSGIGGNSLNIIWLQGKCNGQQTRCNETNEFPTTSRGENYPRSWIKCDFLIKANVGCHFYCFVILNQHRFRHDLTGRESGVSTQFVNCVDGLPELLTVCPKFATWSRECINQTKKVINAPFSKLKLEVIIDQWSDFE